MELFYKEIGTGEPIIILHGLFGSSDNWLSFSRNLADKGFKAILFDLRNHGRSPHTPQHTYDEMALDLKEMVLKLDLNQPAIMGHSMGGKAAMKFAINFPELLSKLIVVDIGPKYYKPHHQKYIAALNAIDLKEITNRAEAEAKIESIIQNPAERQFLLKNLIRNDSGKFEWKINLKVLEEQIDNIGEGLDANHKFRKPTLFIKGSLSNYIKDDDIIMMKWIFPLSTIIEIKDSGHWVHVDKPNELLNAVTNFLNKK